MRFLFVLEALLLVQLGFLIAALASTPTFGKPLAVGLATNVLVQGALVFLYLRARKEEPEVEDTFVEVQDEG